MFALYNVSNGVDVWDVGLLVDNGNESLTVDERVGTEREREGGREERRGRERERERERERAVIHCISIAVCQSLV